MDKRQLVDLGERAVATFAQAFFAVLIADESGITQLDALKVAGVAGALAVCKFLLMLSNTYLAKTPPSA